MGATRLCLVILAVTHTQAIQKTSEETEHLQESGSFIGEMLAGQSWVWLLLGLVAVALVLVLCLAESQAQDLETSLLPLQREKYVVQLWTLTADGTVRVLRHLPIP